MNELDHFAWVVFSVLTPLLTIESYTSIKVYWVINIIKNYYKNIDGNIKITFSSTYSSWKSSSVPKNILFKIKSIMDILNMENKTKTNLRNTNLIFDIKTWNIVLILTNYC